MTRPKQREIAELFVDPGRECVECSMPVRLYGQVLCRACDKAYAARFPRLAIISRDVDETAKNHRDAVHAGKKPPTRLAYDNLSRRIREWLVRVKQAGDKQEIKQAVLMASAIRKITRDSGYSLS
jgi:hypothetical protein